MIFSRRRRNEQAAEPAEADQPVETAEPERRGTGPYDVADAPETPAGGKTLDLGALRIPVVEGIEVRVQADKEGRVQQVALVQGANALQVGAFAAPRSEPIWDEVREEIRNQLRSDGFTSHEVDGEYGPELRTKVRTPDGPKELRFVGVNGPRWMVRALFQGPVAADPTVAPALLECLSGLVVDRGHEAMPAREALPLRLPKDFAGKRVTTPTEDGKPESRQPAAQRRGQRTRRR